MAPIGYLTEGGVFVEFAKALASFCDKQDIEPTRASKAIMPSYISKRFYGSHDPWLQTECRPDGSSGSTSYGEC